MRKLQQIVVLVVACILTGAAGAQVTDTGAPVTTNGTINFIPKWTGTTTLGNSKMFQATNGNVGVGLTNPTSTLDVNGTAKVRGIFQLPTTGTATATSGFNSNSFDQVGSAFSSNVGVAVNQTFRWQVLPLNNNTTTPSGELSLAYGSGANAPMPTGLTVLSNGLINFIPGQPFPGTGTVSSVGSGQGLIGGPITTSGTLSLDTGFTDGRYAQLARANTFSVTQIVSTGGLCQVGFPCASLVVNQNGPGSIFLGEKSGVNKFTVNGNGDGAFAGNLNVAGNLTKGSGSFKIDHPLDPANKYLYHSFVESPDMMNIYNGVVALDRKGQAWITLPAYFKALNADFRYQLTAIGAPGPNLYVAKEISGNRFKVAGGRPGARVSWQVTGIRQDAYAKAHRIQVEEEKPAQERGHYLHPELFGGADQQASETNNSVVLPVTAAIPNRTSR